MSKTDEQIKREKYLLKHKWSAMHRRCENPSDNRWCRYGARGIYVAQEWDSFEPFYMWALANDYHEGLTIERLDNDGPYAPWNCCWKTRAEQARNRSNNHLLTYNGETRTLAEWADITGLQQSTMWRRFKLGWAVKDILTTPLIERNHYITYDGETKTVAEWSRLTGLRPSCITRRLERGWSVTKTLTQPSERGERV